MNKYRDKSDFEINKAVAIKLNLLPYMVVVNDNENSKVIWNVASNDNYGGFISKKGWEFDPCNNPADAMPIVIENGISLISDWNEIGVWGATYQPWWTSENKNPLRAAMEVFLMMKDAENEKS